MKTQVPFLKFIAFALVSFILPAAMLISCGRRVMSPEESALWIEAYVPARLDADAKIRIELTGLSRLRLDSSAVLSNDLFSFSPSVRGHAVLSPDRRFLDFVPEKSMEPGRTYRGRLRMNRLTKVDSLADFAFSFYVDRRSLRFEDVKATIDPDDISMMTVEGNIFYNTAAADSLITAPDFLLLDYPGAQISLEDRRGSAGRRFRVTGIKRRQTPATLKITTNPSYGFTSDACSVDVIPVDEFKLLGAERVEADDPYINLEFSAPLSTLQEPDGLITIDKINEVRLERNGTNVKVFFPRNAIKDLTLHISDLLKNSEGRALDQSIEMHFEQPVIAPAVEIPLEGSILPDQDNLRLPFRAVNLAAVDVEVVKIVTGNVMSYLQENDFSEAQGELRRFGRPVYHRTVRLDKDKSLDLHRWQNFSIDLKNLFRKEPGAIYNIRLSFRRDYSLYDRSEPRKFEEVNGLTAEDLIIWDRAYPYLYRYTADDNWKDYNWNEINDPAKPSYYMVSERMPEHNIVASDLGIIAKKGDDDSFSLAVTRLLSAAPAPGVEVKAYNYQLEELASAVTDERGFATLVPRRRPFMITATDGHSTTYLKTGSAYALSTSNFDVSGTKTPDGVKGFVYGDRGVWRPGDEIHLALIVEDSQGKLPADHPVVMELFTPADQLYSRQTLTEGKDGFYVFHIPTSEQDPTGRWNAKFSVGTSTFNHSVRIATIKPNRLKINIKTPAVIAAGKPQALGLEARWLSGPVAANMAAAIEMTLFSNPSPFKSHKRFTFSNPLVNFVPADKVLCSGRLDGNGLMNRNVTIGSDLDSPGMLQANITARVTEPGGDASITTTSVPFSPFDTYVGIDLTTTDFETDSDISFPVIALDANGNPVAGHKLEYKIYRLDWDWWWEGSSDYLSRYVKSSTAETVAKGEVTSASAPTAIPFRVDYPQWGRYLVFVRDTCSGHATGGVVTVDWPSWRGHADRTEGAGSTDLSFSLDKKNYCVGETANVYFPGGAGGRVLVSVENGSRILKRMWVETSPGKETLFRLPVDRQMAPNFYVTATLLRPHRLTDTTTPLRLFGVQGAAVIDLNSVLHPVIDMPDELHPQKRFSIKVSERDNKPMTYTLAIVDEGLLDISNFKTPRPWTAMNQRQALGVKTWDMFDDVTGAFGAAFRPVLSIGGDEALRKAAGKEKRFNPVVRFIGPFTITGGSKTHTLTLPNYVGSVRVMVVAARDGSYGSSDKTVKVTSPLMLLPTLPRTLACGDRVAMPVNIFAMNHRARRVRVELETSGPVYADGTRERSLYFTGKDEKLVSFNLVCDSCRQGRGRVIIRATDGIDRTSDTIFIDVRNPQPLLIETAQRSLAPGERTGFSWPAANTRSVSLQIASMPAIDFSGALTFMEQYPHTCSEQISSKILFMLYSRRFLDDDGRRRCESVLPALLSSLAARQLPDGGFVYWPGSSRADEWVTSMAGLALSEAARLGFRVNRSALDRWADFQKNTSRSYRYSENTDLLQAYRLYSLAMAGHPQKPAMNRLRESKRLSRTAAFSLAAAYAADGRLDVAEKLAERACRTADSESHTTFASSTRDRAIATLAFALSGKTAEALREARQLAADINGNSYVTQDIAFATEALDRLAATTNPGNTAVEITQPGNKTIAIKNPGAVRSVILNPEAGAAEVFNNGSSALELSLATARRLSFDERIEAQGNGLTLSVGYTNLDGKPLQVSSLKQDTEFTARITVSNNGADIPSAALSYAVPSGWEIWPSDPNRGPDPSADYCDVRDDKINFYFSLPAGKTAEFVVRLRAAYLGQYTVPAAVAEDMYDPSRRALTGSQRITVAL